MKKLLLGFILYTAVHAHAQDVQVIGPDWIDRIRNTESDTLYIINFWATWCKPCVEELPYFEKIGEKYRAENVKVLLVSTDMRKDLHTRLKEFITAKKLKQQVLFMNEVNADKWIDKVNTGWSGAIPATWIIKGSTGLNYFKEGELTEGELEALVANYIK